ncbi:MAG: hypothetical protein FWC51_01600 [Proteobacteria bacterium]|nr:hypothetical protein [Pseudomonadota bacterium]
MKEKNSIIATRLMNLYRAAHVIAGGWATVNAVFVSDANASVLEELKKLPTGEKLTQHIRNLQSGKTPMDSISRELMPYGGLMESPTAGTEDLSTGISEDDFKKIESALNDFQPDQDHLNAIQSIPAVAQFGDRWLAGIRATISGHPDLLAKWRIVYSAERAYSLWERANSILSWPATERTRAEVQAEIQEYEMYLPMFGDAGNDTLIKLRNFISSV